MELFHIAFARVKAVPFLLISLLPLAELVPPVKCKQRHSLRLLGPALLAANHFCSLEPEQSGGALAKAKAQFKSMCICQHLQGLRKDICREQNTTFFFYPVLLGLN